MTDTIASGQRLKLVPNEKNPLKTQAEADAELLQIAENLDTLEVRAKRAREELKEAYTAAEEKGYDRKALKQAVRHLHQEEEKVQWELFSQIVDTYDLALARAVKAREGQGELLEERA